jgi:hypothetical protein
MLKSVSASAAAMVLGLAVCISATPGNAKSSATRLRCDAVGASDSSVSATYDQRVNKKQTRTKFGVEFEATTTGGFVAGTPVVFSVDTVAVGTVPLASVGPADLEAELRLDSKAHGRGHKKSFPPGFPVVQAGSMVEVAVGGTVVLGCALDLN